MNAVNFQLKGSVVTAIVLELYQFSSENFAEELQIKVQQAPALFDQSAVVISLEKFTGDYDLINFVSLVEQCRAAGMQPMAFRGGDDFFADSIRATGLAWLPANGSRSDERMPIGREHRRLRLRNHVSRARQSRPVAERAVLQGNPQKSPRLVVY